MKLKIDPGPARLSPPSHTSPPLLGVAYLNPAAAIKGQREVRDNHCSRPESCQCHPSPTHQRRPRWDRESRADEAATAPSLAAWAASWVFLLFVGFFMDAQHRPLRDGMDLLAQSPTPATFWKQVTQIRNLICIQLPSGRFSSFPSLSANMNWRF